MQAKRLESVRDLVEGGARLRVWCFRCNRGHVLEAGDVVVALQRLGLVDQMISELGRRFRCRACRRGDQVLALPASGAPFEEAAPGQATSRLIESFFHGMRSAGKRRR